MKSRRAYPDYLTIRDIGGVDHVFCDVGLRVEILGNFPVISFVYTINPRDSSNVHDYRKLTLILTHCELDITPNVASTGFHWRILQGAPRVVINPHAPASISPSPMENFLCAHDLTGLSGFWAGATGGSHTEFPVIWGLKFGVEQVYASRHDFHRYLKTFVFKWGNLLEIEHQTQSDQVKPVTVDAAIARNLTEPAYYNLVRSILSSLLFLAIGHC